MNRNEYRKARRLVRSNGLYALRWLSPDHASAMFAISRPAADVLAQRVDLARREPAALAFRLTQIVATRNKARHTI